MVSKFPQHKQPSLYSSFRCGIPEIAHEISSRSSNSHSARTRLCISFYVLALLMHFSSLMTERKGHEQQHTRRTLERVVPSYCGRARFESADGIRRYMNSRL